MNLFWIIYWFLLLISLIFSVYVFIKKNRLMGIIQGILTIGYSLFSSLYVLLNRDYTTGISEIDFVISSLLKGEIGATFIFLFLILLIIVFVSNLFGFINEQK